MTKTIRRPTAYEVARAEAGIQCPECFGVNISWLRTRFQAAPTGFQCEDCGCNWSKKIGRIT